MAKLDFKLEFNGSENILVNKELVKMGIPIVCADITARDAIPESDRLVEGKYAKAQVGDKIYKLDGGIANANWQEVIVGVDGEQLDAAVASAVVDKADVSALNVEKARIDNLLAATTNKADKLNPVFMSNESSEDVSYGENLVDGTGWTLGTGWTGDFATGYTHASGNVATLERAITGLTAGKLYMVQLTATPAVGVNEASDFYVSLGGSDHFETYKGIADSISFEFGIICPDPLANTNLVITPSEGYAGVISDIEVREVASTILAAFKVSDNTSSAVLEFRATNKMRENIFLGKEAGIQTLGSGENNTAFGHQAMRNNTSGYWNVAVGHRSLYKNTVGSRNVGIGRQTLRENTTGTRNIAIGSFSLYQNTTGYNNVSVGVDCLYNNTTGYKNIGIGKQALAANTTGTENIAIGELAMGTANAETGNNIAIGNKSLSKVTGQNNIALGTSSLYRLTTGSNNVGIGLSALNSNVEGSYNMGIGFQALFNATGSNNVAIGSSSCKNNTSGGNNTAIGYKAMGGATTSGVVTGNVAIGYLAGYVINSGEKNVFIGCDAGKTSTEGSYNILIGNNIQAPAATSSYALNIGDTIKGDLQTKMVEFLGGITAASLPTSDPLVAGQIWSNSGVLTVSAG